MGNKEMDNTPLAEIPSPSASSTKNKNHDTSEKDIQEDNKKMDFLSHLNHFYVIIAVLMSVAVLFLMFSLSADNRELIEHNRELVGDVQVLIEQRNEDFDQRDLNARERLEILLEAIEESDENTNEQIQSLERRIEQIDSN